MVHKIYRSMYITRWLSSKMLTQTQTCTNIFIFLKHRSVEQSQSWSCPGVSTHMGDHSSLLFSAAPGPTWPHFSAQGHSFPQSISMLLGQLSQLCKNYSNTVQRGILRVSVFWFSLIKFVFSLLKVFYFCLAALCPYFGISDTSCVKMKTPL